MKNIVSKILLIAALSLSSLQLFAGPHDGNDGWERPESPRIVQRRVKRNIKVFFRAAVDFDKATLERMVNDLGINVHERDEDGRDAYYHCVMSYLFARTVFNKKIAETSDNKKHAELIKAREEIQRLFNEARFFLESQGAQPFTRKEVKATRAKIRALEDGYGVWKKYEPRVLVSDGVVTFRHPEADAYGVWS